MCVTGTECTVTGFGHTKENGQFSNKLRQVKLPLRPLEYCEKSYEDEVVCIDCFGVILSTVCRSILTVWKNRFIKCRTKAPNVKSFHKAVGLFLMSRPWTAFMLTSIIWIRQYRQYRVYILREIWWRQHVYYYYYHFFCFFPRSTGLMLVLVSGLGDCCMDCRRGPVRKE